MEIILGPYRNLYAAIAGRASRSQFWLFSLYYVGGVIVFYAVFGGVMAVNMIGARGGQINPIALASSMAAVSLFMIPFLVWLYPSALAHLALTCRRLHDQDRSAWYVLIGFIPVLGWLIMLILLLLPGTGGPNRYGADPREAATPSDVFA